MRSNEFDRYPIIQGEHRGVPFFHALHATSKGQVSSRTHFFPLHFFTLMYLQRFAVFRATDE